MPVSDRDKPHKSHKRSNHSTVSSDIRSKSSSKPMPSEVASFTKSKHSVYPKQPSPKTTTSSNYNGSTIFDKLSRVGLGLKPGQSLSSQIYASASFDKPEHRSDKCSEVRSSYSNTVIPGDRTPQVVSTSSHPRKDTASYFDAQEYPDDRSDISGTTVKPADSVSQVSSTPARSTRTKHRHREDDRDERRTRVSSTTYFSRASDYSQDGSDRARQIGEQIRGERRAEGKDVIFRGQQPINDDDEVYMDELYRYPEYCGELLPPRGMYSATEMRERFARRRAN